jgi:hypothetical protein
MEVKVYFSLLVLMIFYYLLQTKTKNFFNDGGGWAGLGSVKFTPIGTIVDKIILQI